MLVLVETPAGYGLFRVKNKKLLEIEDATDLSSFFASSEAAQKSVALEAFSQFKDTRHALDEVLALRESKMSKGLKKFLKKNLLKDEETCAQLAVSDKALGASIKNKLGIDVVFTPTTHELIRGIKEQMNNLLEGLSAKDRQQMAMSLAHSLNRFKLKFSPEKLDTMIIQAVALLDDLDRELNNFAMRLKEWYGWHFPELSKIVTDNLIYAKTVQLIGFRTNTKHVELSPLLPDEIAAEVKMSAETSMGTDITDEDLTHINTLASRVEELVEYRANLAEYLKVRMKVVAPNLTYMVGEVIGARLMAHSGSLLNLSKQPASTIQILGAEKALFRALKTKSHTPKYGLLFHAALVGQAPPKLKGKISRVLAAKLSLCVRVDALTEAAEAAAAAAGSKGANEVAPAQAPTEPTVAISCRRYVENKLMQLEQQQNSGLSRSTAKPPVARYEPKRQMNGKTYDTSADIVAEESKAKKHKHDEVKHEDDEEKPKKKKIKREKED
ncbi:putative nucleolar protein 5 [Besnoitia besnoiti]|uniref:Putative nucleolar protein 5 n=1 Tax=Besnoitia besnoiti TaxID=94643 RepID=A0A2A9MJ11_BESBE|nr:putative nucleolar protein 5 [Besnoitia besnoiti]PFH35956.1 putative nucleolar protein 5 [Besnoitia besnoiti]